MKLILNKKDLNEAPAQFLRRAGYSYFISRKTGEESFVRPLGRSRYPQFHVYAEEAGDQVMFNLHLDQKQPSYAGAHAHNAEYEGEIVEREIERLKQLTKN